MEETPKPKAKAKMRSAYELIERAGPRLAQLKQVHGHLMTTGRHRSKPLLTKLALLSCSLSQPAATSYTRKLSLSVPNPDTYLFNSLIRVSSNLPSRQNDVVFYYNAMLYSSLPPCSFLFSSVFKSLGHVSGLGLGRRVHCHVVVGGFGVDVYVQAGLVAFYSKCGEVGVARKVFDEMPERSVVAWNAMISGYESNGFADEAVQVFRLMRGEGVKPDEATFAGVLSACAQLGVLEVGTWVHDCIVDCGVGEGEGEGEGFGVVVETALINMYTRCGDVRKAREVFDGMKERNVVSWTSIISGYGAHGYGKEAMEMYEWMKLYGPEPNRVTFVAVLSACAHAGLVDEGRKIFSAMTEVYGVKPGVEHHVCMVDLLGRAGLLNEAYDHVRGLKKPRAAMWTALLGACKMHKNLDLGVEVAEKLLAIQPENPGHYVMLSNVYALAGKMDKVEKVRNVMIRKKLKKTLGYSIIEVDQKAHMFTMGDKSHHETSEIYKYLDDLIRRITEAGYVPAQESVLHELEEEERVHALRYHSEKLAIAFGLLKVKNENPIRIVKNLRMCEDCHLAIKFISSVTNREIIVRDKLRFHHFKDGKCSCGDYW